MGMDGGACGGGDSTGSAGDGGGVVCGAPWNHGSSGGCGGAGGAGGGNTVVRLYTLPSTCTLSP